MVSQKTYVLLNRVFILVCWTHSKWPSLSQAGYKKLNVENVDKVNMCTSRHRKRFPLELMLSVLNSCQSPVTAALIMVISEFAVICFLKLR